jgi:hypothetical protein
VVYGTNPLYTPDSLVRELVTDVHKKSFYRRFMTPTFFKSHLLPQPDYRRVVYLLRDGRDAMVSYYHYLTGWRGNEVDFMDMVTNGEGLICKWHDHVEAWLANPYGAEMLVIKYEDLKLDTVQELQRFCGFAGVERELSWLEQVAESATFDKMQNKEKAGSYFEKSAGSEDVLFFRRGIIGSYKDEMPPEVLTVFMQDSQKTLLRCGYAVEEAAVGSTAE